MTDTVISSVVVESTGNVLQTTESTSVILTGQLGPPGPPGPPGGAITANAGEALGGHRAILINSTGLAFYINNTIPTHLGRLAGITTSASVINALVQVTNFGWVTEPSWAWVTDSPVYIGASGLLTQTLPSSGFIQIIGIATSATTLFINPREPLATI